MVPYRGAQDESSVYKFEASAAMNARMNSNEAFLFETHHQLNK